MKKRTLNKKGFTLIELLAVIVILGIILVIAVPGVLDTVNNSKRGVARDQAMLIFKAAETCVINEQSLSSSPDIIKCSTLDGLKSGKYYTPNAGEKATINIDSDGVIKQIKYIEKENKKGVMCAYSSGDGKNNINGGTTQSDTVTLSNVTATNCK